MYVVVYISILMFGISVCALHTYIYIYKYVCICIYLYTYRNLYIHTEETLLRAEAMAAGRDHSVANDHVNVILRRT